MTRLLIVDDEYIVRVTLTSIIDWSKYGITEVLTAGSGKEALEIFESRKIDILIVDIRMPGMDGLALIRSIRSKGYDTPCIVMTAYEEFEYAREAFRLGIHDLIVKNEICVSLFDRIMEKLSSDDYIKTVPGDGSISTETMEATNNKTDHLFKSEGCHYKVRKVIRYMEERYAEPISLESAAGFADISPAHLSRIFNKNLGMSFTDYLIEFRMKKAFELLKNSNYHVYEVSNMVGYPNVQHFVKMFKRLTGKTPIEYRSAL